nr:glycosyltransferase [uncultured Oscillibacter sp.]
MILKTDAPLFSVIVLTYLQRHYLEECLDSIFRQTYPNIELIVCDDCSADFRTDEVLAYIQENQSGNITNVKVFRQPKNVGPVQNALTGVSLSSGVFFKIHAGDDLLNEDDALERAENLFQNTGAGVIACRSRACQPDGSMTDHYYPDPEAWNCIIHADAETQFNLLATQGAQIYFHEPALFWRRSVYDEVGGIDPEFRCVTDWPLLLRVTGAGHRVMTVDEPLVIFRYGGIMNRNPVANLDFRIEYYRESIAILKKYGLARFEAAGLRKKVLRCRHAIACLENRIVAEERWGGWTLGRQLCWRVKNLGFFLMAWLYRLRYGKPSIPHAKPALLAMAISLALYVFQIQLPGEFSPFLWSLLFFAAAVWLLAQTAVVLSLRLFNLILNLLGRRR